MMGASLWALGLTLLCAVGVHAFGHDVGLRLRETPISLMPDVPVDPSGDQGPKRVAGYFALNRTKAAEMFYFFFESRDDPANDPVVLWMTENGPFKINDDMSLSESKYGWDVGNNVIFVDQPIGTGFSYSNDPADTVYDEKGVADDMLDFLLEFLDAHPHLAGNKLFVTGESYAGHYVPAVSHRIWKWNKDTKNFKINFKGLAIGNGLTDPAIQYGAYADFALDNGLIDQRVHDRIERVFPACKLGIDTCNGHGWRAACQAAVAYCQAAVFGQILLAAPGVNVYDVRKQCEGPLCYDFSNLDKYINQPEVRRALGVGDRTWASCDATVHQDMMGDWMKDYATMLPAMLADGVRVMIYAGDKDLICNWLGNRRWVDALDWEGADDWANDSDFEWSVDGSSAGLVRSVGPLSFVKVYDAGHMVPMDQGKHALDMITRFVRDRSFGSKTKATSGAASGAMDRTRVHAMSEKLRGQNRLRVEQ